MAGDGSPAPVFETDEDHSYFLVRLPVHEGFAAAFEPVFEEVILEGRALGDQVTPEVIRLLAVMDGEMSRTELMAVLGLKDEKHFRERYQQAAIAHRLIDMTIPQKPRGRLQKYRLTELGRQRLATKDPH